MDHFVKCVEYGESLEIDWKEIYEENIEHQFKIGKFIEKRFRKRDTILKQQEGGQTSKHGSMAPVIL